MTTALDDVQSIAGAKARIRIEQQRQSFEHLAAAIAQAGHKNAARAFRAEAERAIARAVEFEQERLERDAERAALQAIRSEFDRLGVPTVANQGRDLDRALTDVERLEWMLYNHSTVLANDDAD